MKFEAQLDDEIVPVEVTDHDGRYRVELLGRTWQVDGRRVAEGLWSLVIDDVSSAVDVSETEGVFVVQVDGERYAIRVEEETRYIIRTRGGTASTAGQVLKAPMPGRVVHVAVQVGQAVQPGDGLVVLEAMKMENEFKATGAGTVKEVRVAVGQVVNPGDVLVVIE
jgi:biotin carboxyl carrier protein